MALIEVDIDEFETYDVFLEAASRLRNFKVIDTPTNYEKRRNKAYEMLEAAFKVRLIEPDTKEDESLDDQMKNDHLKNIWSKYTAADFERLLP